jgi:aspartate/methionine/tyrosine aminotransferase
MSAFDKSLSTLSARARVLATTPTLPYMSQLIAGLGNQYHPIDNPEGTVLLAVAENKLSSDLVLSKVRHYAAEAPPHVLNYTSSQGLPTLRAALATFLSERVFNSSSAPSSPISVDAAQLVVGAGCVSGLVSLSMLLFEPGDSLLTPAPYYPAFDKDFLNFGDAVVCPVHCEADSELSEEGQGVSFGRLTVAALDRAYAAAQSRVRALLLTNPGNPTGALLSREELLLAINWANEKDIHLIVDEIYGLSLFSDGDFVSAVTLLNNKLGDRVHFLWSFSKDLCASGLRVGVLYTQNSALLAALSATNDAMMASNLTQYALQRVIEDRPFLDMFFRENRVRLLQSLDFLRDQLNSLGVRMHRTEGAIFAFCDFSRFLPVQTFAAERELFARLAGNGVLFTPGESCHCPRPGYFRVCYAFVSFEALQEACRRLQLLFAS